MTSANSGIRKKRQLRACKVCGHPYDIVKAMCPVCKSWDAPNISAVDDETVLLSEVSENPLERISDTGPWDPCFSYDPLTKQSGIVTIQAVLIGGAPGAGKSTLSLMLSARVAKQRSKEILYIGAEEAKEQIKDRGQRLELKEVMNLMRIYPMGATSELGEIFRRRRPCAVIIDSLQGLTQDLELQVDYCKTFKDFAVELNAPFIIISQVTKEEDMAGLMALQHVVDTTMLFTVLEDKTREIETIKNRFGPPKSVYLKMTQTGLIEAKGYADDDGDDGETDRDWIDGDE